MKMRASEMKSLNSAVLEFAWEAVSTHWTKTLLGPQKSSKMVVMEEMNRKEESFMAKGRGGGSSHSGKGSGSRSNAPMSKEAAGKLGQERTSFKVKSEQLMPSVSKGSVTSGETPPRLTSPINVL